MLYLVKKMLMLDYLDSKKYKLEIVKVPYQLKSKVNLIIKSFR